jgi:hypothetical protein
VLTDFLSVEQLKRYDNEFRRGTLNISEEVLESNRISLADHTGTKMVSIYPKVNGSVSDADIERETTAAHTADPSVPVRTRAEESDLTTDRLNWVLGATIGVKLAFPFGPPS